MKSHYPYNEVRRTIYFIIFWTSFITIIFLLASCESSKHLDKTSKTTEQENKVDSASIYKQSSDSLFKLLMSERITRKTGIVFGPDRVMPLVPDEELIDDCPPCPANEVEIKADGSIRAKGNISAVQYDEQKYRDSIVELRTEKQSELNKRMSAELKLREAEKSKVLVVEKTFLYNWWIWYLAGLLSGIILLMGLAWYINKKTRIDI